MSAGADVCGVRVTCVWMRGCESTYVCVLARIPSRRVLVPSVSAHTHTGKCARQGTQAFLSVDCADRNQYPPPPFPPSSSSLLYVTAEY